MKDCWVRVALLSIGLIAALFGLALLIDRLIGSPFVAGMYFGGAVVGYLAGLHWIVDLVSGEHNNKYGTHGEESTSEVLRSRRMRARGWQVIDGVSFAGFDVDHVALRPGLVIAVESKWTNTRWTIKGDRLRAPRDPAQQARRNAATIRRFLRGHADVEVAVFPVVAVWGKGAESLPRDVSFVDGVWLFRGDALADLDGWLAPFDGAYPTCDDVDRCVDALREFVALRDDHEARARHSARG